MSCGIVSEMFDKCCYCMIKTYMCIWSRNNDNKVESFVIDKVDIEVLDTNRKISEQDKENITNYLRHHIMYTDHEFKEMNFDEPLFIKFIHKKETYRICLNRLRSKNTEQNKIVKEPRCLSVVVNDECITNRYNEYHGPNKNFFSHIPDTINCVNILFKEYKGKNIHIFDILGNSSVVKIDPKEQQIVEI
jgi:hypothetical protein